MYIITSKCFASLIFFSIKEHVNIFWNMLNTLKKHINDVLLKFIGSFVSFREGDYDKLVKNKDWLFDLKTF